MALFRRLSFIMFFIGLIGCGGGGGGLDGGGNTDPGDTSDPITITLNYAPTGVTVSNDNPLTVTATVMQGTSPISNRLVSFSLSDSELAYFEPENGGVATGNDGIASITLYAGGKSGGGNLLASIDDGEVAAEPLAFNSAGDGNVGTTPTVEVISLFTSSPQIASSGADEVTLTAITKDNRNNLLEGVEVSFSTDSGDIEVINGTTGPDGKATALLKTDSDAANRVVSVTATSGLRTDTVDVQVVGTTVTLTGSSSLALNDTNTYIINVLDSDGNGLAGKVVNLSLGNASTETPAADVAQITIPDSVTTDFTGQATVNVTGTSGGSNSIIASVLGAIVQKGVSVQADSFLFTSFDNGDGSLTNPSSNPVVPDVLLSDSAEITLTWLRSGQAVPDGTLINFTATRGTLASSSATTVNGMVTTTISSLNAGKALITFSGNDGDIALDNQIEFEFIAENATDIVAQAFPSSIGPNGETSTVSVIVKDNNGNLVKNKTIDFNLSDTNGGSIFPASAVTDSNGSASTVYTSNAVSASGGVSITATVKDMPMVQDTVNLTVADRELFISVGTGNDIIEVDVTTYNKEFTVFVTDVDSTPVENVELTVNAVPKSYYKGKWVRLYDTSGNFIVWGARGSDWIEGVGGSLKHLCSNEDTNVDGILDLGEDTNSDGLLTPGNIVAAEGNLVTDDQGRAVIDILYPQSFGFWVDVDLVVSTKVNGTENFAHTVFTLPVNATDINEEDKTPPTSSIGLNGPLGLLPNCSVAD